MRWEQAGNVACSVGQSSEGASESPEELRADRRRGGVGGMARGAARQDTPCVRGLQCYHTAPLQRQRARLYMPLSEVTLVAIWRLDRRKAAH